LAKSPENLMPPSAITGVPSPAAAAQSMIAVSCGTPTPATMRVVQIEPGPMPTFTASAPASISARVASAVATLPAITCTSFDRFLHPLTASPRLGMAMGGVDHDQVDARIDQRLGAFEARIAHGRGRRHAQAAQLILAGRRVQHRLLGVLQRQQPGQLALPSVTSSFSIRRAFIRFFASSRSPARAGWRGSRRSSSLAPGVSSASAKRMSRLVTMPRTRPLSSTTGNPVKP
jgi:hypothetical protein